MDWLKNLPIIGPFVARLMRTHAWRSYETLERVHWSRLAAAITFISFIAIFPLITVGAAIGAALLSRSQLDRVQNTIADQVPGISDQLNIDTLVTNAGTVGVVAGAFLLVTGIGWVSQLRQCLRAVWERDNKPEGNPFVRKAKDGLLLVGLGAIGLASLAASGFGSTAVGWTARQLDIPSNGAGGLLLQAGAIAIAVIADFLVLLFVLTLLPQVQPKRQRLIVAALIGSIGFEVLKLLLGGYLSHVAGRSMYGAFGTPVALLLWINFTAKLLMVCAAWTATPSKDEPSRAELNRQEDEREKEEEEREKAAEESRKAREEQRKQEGRREDGTGEDPGGGGHAKGPEDTGRHDDRGPERGPEMGTEDDGRGEGGKKNGAEARRPAAPSPSFSPRLRRAGGAASAC